MAQRDIEIRIKARDEASANAKKISDSLKKIGVDAKGVAVDVGKAGAAMDALASDVSRLQQDAGRLSALGKLATQIDKAGIAAERSQRGISAATAEFQAFRREHHAATTTVAELTARLAAEKNAQIANTAAMRDAREQRTLANREAAKALTLESKLAQVQTPRVRKGIGIEAGAPVSSARASAQAFFAPEIEKARASQAQAEVNVGQLASEAKALKAALAGTQAELTAASGELRRFESSTERAGNALLAARSDAAQAQTRLQQLTTSAADASKALGGVAVSQDDVARAAQKNAAELARVQQSLAAYQKFATGGGDIADPKTAAALRQQNAAVSEAKDDLAALRTEAARLAVEMKASSGNVTKQVDDFKRMAAAVRAAEAELVRQQVALNRLRGVTQSSFGAWARAVVPLQQASAATQSVGKAASGAAGSQNRLRTAIQGTGLASGQASRQTGVLSQSILGLGRDTRQTLSYMQRMRGEVLSMAAGFVGLYAAIDQGRGALNAFRTVEALQSRLGAAFQQNTGAVAQEISWLRSESDRLAVGFSTMADQYGKFSVATNAAGMSAKTTRDVFTSLAEAGRVNKLSTDQMAGAFLALEQIVSKGKFTAEEVRGQLGERLPGAFNILADSLGVTTVELDKMMEAGEVLASEDNLLKFADELKRRFGPQLSSSLDSVTADLGRFENDVFNARLALAQGFIPELRKALQAFNAFANSADGAAAFAAIGEAAGSLVGLIAQIPQYFDEMKVAAGAFAAVKLAGVLLGISDGARKSLAAFTGLSRGVLVTAAQMRQMNAVERTMAVSFNQTIGTLSRKRAMLLSTAAATNTLTMRNRIMITSLGAARTVIAATAVSLRALYAAFGGLPGIIATGISLALVGWATSTNDATASLAAHTRILERVKEGYTQVGDRADQWAKNVRNVTLAQAIDNIVKLRQEYSAAAKEVARVQSNVLFSYERMGEVNPSDPRAKQAAQIRSLADLLQSGAISAQVFSDEMNKIALSAADDTLKSIALEMLNLVNNTDEGTASVSEMGDRLAEASAVVRVMRGVASDADKKLLGLSNSVSSTAQSAQKAINPMDTYREALGEIKKLIPSLADDMERLEKITKLTAGTWTAFSSAMKAGDIKSAMEALSLGLQGLGEMGIAQRNTQMDQYFGGSIDDYIKRTIYVEGGQDGSGPSTSSARGIGQFTDSTWLGYFDSVFTDLRDLTREQKLSMRTNREAAEKMLKAFTYENASALQRNNLTPTNGNLYLSHFLGSGDAIKVLLANPDALAKDLVNASSVKANPSVFKDGMTAGDLISWANGKMGGGQAITGSGATQGELDKQESWKKQAEAMHEAFKKSQEQAKATKERIADLDYQLAQQKLINAEQGKQAAIEAAIRDAQKENPQIGEAELARIRETTAALYDQQNAREGVNLAEEKVNQLYELRQQLLEQQTMAKDAGNFDLVANLKTQIEGVNAQLQTAIQNAVAMWKAVGGPESDAAIAKLNTTGMSLKDNSDRMVAFGLTAQQIGSTTQSIVDGLISVFDAFAQAIANGENAVKAMGTAFLQFAANFMMQIAQMILQQIILNALAGFAGGGGFGGAIGNAAVGLGGIAGHTGGKVGSAAIGGGNRIGSFGQQYRHALVMHEGGRVGLKPNEVNATLKVGEEVLTEQDPNHSSNRGGETSFGGDRGIKQVLAMGDDEIANALNGAAGERVILTMLRRNRATIRTMLG